MPSPKSGSCSDERGRPREFNVDEALQIAQGVFLRSGYEGTSLSDLTNAMGVNKPSLYAAYGNKEQLFVRVIKAYHQLYQNFAAEHFQDTSDPRETVYQWLLWFLNNFESDRDCKGCLIVNSACLTGREHAQISETVAALHAKNEEILGDFLKRAQRDGHLDPEINTLTLSRFYNAVVQGMAVLQRSQSSPQALADVVKQAMAAWPR